MTLVLFNTFLISVQDSCYCQSRQLMLLRWFCTLFWHDDDACYSALHTHTHTHTNILLLYCHLQHHNNTIIKMQEDFFINICTSHFIVRVQKGLLEVFVWEGVGDRTETAIFWPHSYGRQRCVFSCSPDAQPEAQRPTLLGDGFLYCILSASSLDPNSIGGPEHLRPVVAFLTTSRL